MGVAKIVLIGIVVLGLVVLYAVMAMGSWSRSTRKDLRPGRREKTAKRLSSGGGLASTGTGRGGIGGGTGQLRRRVRALG